MAVPRTVTPLREVSTRKKINFLRDAVNTLGDPDCYLNDPVGYGMAYQRVHDAFAMWGWDGIFESKTVMHNFGRRQRQRLADLYAEWMQEPWRDKS